MFDLKDLKPKSNTIKVELRHPSTGDLLDMSISVYNPYSPEYKAAMHEQTNKRLMKSAKVRKQTYTAQELEASALELLASITEGWSITFEGKALKFSREKAVELFSEYPWIKDQLEEALNDTSGFLMN
jgi:hypothetical protein